jgi:uncharacterized lipoprotein YmbA
MKKGIPNFLRCISTLVLSMFVLLLSGCSTSSKVPSETNYYLLNSQSVAKPLVIINQTVAVKVLELPAYLHQPHLVMQLNKHQLHYARFDMWAEPLQSGITKALIHDLNLNNKHIQFVANGFLSDNNKANKLIVRVDYFHPSTASKVILSGVFWKESSESQNIVQQPFSFELLLDEDGYTHAIAQMRQLISTMSESVLLDSY